MASLLALLSSALWGSADFFAGRMSKKHHPFAVLGFSQVIGLFVGLLILVISGNWQGKVFGFDGYLIPGALAGLAGYIGLACLYEGLSTGRMGVVAPISSMSAIVRTYWCVLRKWTGVISGDADQTFVTCIRCSCRFWTFTYFHSRWF
jgi:uncharacterized membrane protein